LKCSSPHFLTSLIPFFAFPFRNPHFAIGNPHLQGFLQSNGEGGWGSFKFQQAVEKRPSAALPSSFVVAAYIQVRLTPQDFGCLASGHF
jgi:hypothetical protein